MRIAACLLVVIAVGLASAGRTQPARIASKPYGVDPPAGFAHTSAASCSASACHGGGTVGQRGSEHSTWAPELDPKGDSDPHSKAYRVLFNADSVRIAKLLGGGPAHENVLCLKCHAPAGVAEPTARAEGVGCSACHGPSDKWLDSHYLPEWKAKSNREKWNDGFVPSKNLTARISNCATCHVGSADRDVNHDLIAAGHPRLAFEYTRFHYSGTYRKHWEEKTPQPDFEVRAWIIGQAATARAAADVLHGRALKAHAAPWPEFAGLSCFACHQGIGEKPPRGSNGMPGWEVFHTAALDAASTRSHLLFPGVKAPELMKYGELKRKMNTGTAKPADVVPLAAAARAELDAWLAAMQQSEEANPRSSEASTQTVDATFFFAMVGGAVNAKDWDTLAAYYLGAAAMHHASGGHKAHPLTRKPLGEIRLGLKFPEGFNNPKGFDPDKVRAGFRDLLNAAIEERSR